MKNIINIIKISKPLYPLMIVMAVLILSTSAMQLVTPVISKMVVDEIVKEVESDSGNLDTMYSLIAFGFALGIVGITITALTERVGDHFSGELRKYLTEKFYDKVFRLPQSYFDSEISGKIVNQLGRGIATIQGFVNTSTNFILPSFLQSIFIITLLSYYNPLIGLFVFLLFPVYIVISYYSSARWGKKEVVKNEIEDLYRGRITEVISNIKLVKGFTNEKNEYDLVSNKLLESNKIYAKQSREYHLFDFVRNFSLALILLGIDLMAFYQTFNGSLTIGELVLVVQLVGQARWPLYGMSFILGQIQQAEAGSKEYFEVMKIDSKENYESEDKVERIKNPNIEFKNVEFRYDTSENVLENISFELKNNEIVALVGPSGAGKSTIINLILKFYENTAGEIFLNGKSYNDLSHKFVRENISLVFQENELFSSTIKENVAYGQDGVTDEQIVAALKKANAWEFVSKLKDGIDSQIGERGVRLSGGQKQRIQIARAILKDAPILILDEATSSLDAKSESEVQDALENLTKNRLTIIIAHRFSTIQNATKVVVVNDKKIEAIGSPQDLAKRDGMYKDLLNYQIEGNKKLLKRFDIY